MGYDIARIIVPDPFFFKFPLCLLQRLIPVFFQGSIYLSSLPSLKLSQEMVMEAPPTPQCVGREFVRQYYTLLNKAPAHLHR